MTKDVKLTTAMGWDLVASYDGENWTLHVENDWKQGASLTCAVNECEVYDARKGHEVPLKQATLSLFNQWHDQYDAFTRDAERIATQRGY